MSFKRKKEDAKRLEKLFKTQSGGYPPAVYFDKYKNRLVRLWKSEGKRSHYKWCKKRSSKEIRLYLKRHDVYTKKASDLWNRFI